MTLASRKCRVGAARPSVGRPTFRASPPCPLGFALFHEEDIALWKFLEQCRVLPDIGGEDVGRIAGDPLRQIDRLVMPAVEDNEDACLVLADIFDRMSEPC